MIDCISEARLEFLKSKSRALMKPLLFDKITDPQFKIAIESAWESGWKCCEMELVKYFYLKVVK